MAFTIYSPLREFAWPGHAFEIAPGIDIAAEAVPPKVNELAEDMLAWEWDWAGNATHWLCFRWAEDEPTSFSEIVNLILLALWIANPTKTRVEFTFVIADKDQGPHTVKRHLDRFEFIAGKNYVPFAHGHLQRAQFLFARLLALYQRNGRLNATLLLTITGCRTIEWSTALVCHAAAAEGLLTYATEFGITRRLATTFACFTRATVADRDGAYAHFRRLYDARSDIMHGRVHNIPMADRLAKLDAWQDAIRELWAAACDTPAMMAALEGTDDDRRMYFDAIAGGYAPPPWP